MIQAYYDGVKKKMVYEAPKDIKVSNSGNKHRQIKRYDKTTGKLTVVKEQDIQKTINSYSDDVNHKKTIEKIVQQGGNPADYFKPATPHGDVDFTNVSNDLAENLRLAKVAEMSITNYMDNEAPKILAEAKKQKAVKKEQKEGEQ